MTTHDVAKAPSWLRDFVRESNRIENIKDTIGADIAAHQRLLDLEKVRVPDLEMFVRTITRDHVLRDKVGLDVRVGGHIPPSGGPGVRGGRGRRQRGGRGRGGGSVRPADRSVRPVDQPYEPNDRGRARKMPCM